MRWGRIDDRDRCRLAVSRVPVFARDHQPLRLAVPPVPVERPRRAGADARTWCRVSYETIRAWCERFGQEYANQLRRRGPRPGDKWHLDEVFVQINGAQRYLWRAVDQHGNVLDILVQSRRNAEAVFP